MQHVLVTGGSGFFGGVLKRRLLRDGYSVTNIDLVSDPEWHPCLISLQGDIRKADWLREVFQKNRFDAVFHCAAMLAHGTHIDEPLLWSSNVNGTRNIAEAARAAGVPKLLFTSTNCLWAANYGHPITEEEEPCPIEIYGRSKLEGERILSEYATGMDVTILRCPTIIDSGRLGLLAILFEFIQENKTVWVVGNGNNTYQFIYAQDLAAACLLAMHSQVSGIYHIGSDRVRPLREVYETVIQDAGSQSRVRSLPKGPTIAAMKLAHRLGVSPLGPYHYRMIAEDFLFDTTKIKRELFWLPTLTNEQMLIRAYRYYQPRREEIRARTGASAHCRPTEMGVIRFLKWVS